MYMRLFFSLLLVELCNGKGGLGALFRHFNFGVNVGRAVSQSSTDHQHSSNHRETTIKPPSNYRETTIKPPLNYRDSYRRPVITQYRSEDAYRHSTFRAGFDRGSQTGALRWESALLANTVISRCSFVEYKNGNAIFRSTFVHDGRQYRISAYPFMTGKNQCSMPTKYLRQRDRRLDYKPIVLASNSSAYARLVLLQGIQKNKHVDKLDELVGILQFANHSNSTQILWECNWPVEECCGIECCLTPVPDVPKPLSKGPSNCARGGFSGWAIALIVFCCYFCTYMENPAKPNKHREDNRISKNVNRSMGLTSKLNR